MKKSKKVPLIALAVVAAIVVLLFIADFIITNRIESRLEEFLGGPSSYESLDVDLLQRQITLKGLNYSSEGKDISAKKVSLTGISLYDYIVNNKIEIDNVELLQPSILLVKQDSAAKGSAGNFDRDVLISNFEARNGSFSYKKDSTAGNALYFSFPRISLSQVQIDSSTVSEKIPFNYKEYHIKGDSARINMNPQHYIAAGLVDIDNGKTLVRDFRIIPYHTSEDFDQRVPYEKDRISLRVDSLQLSDLKFFFERDTLHLKNPSMTVTEGNLQIYRNKTLPDSPIRRPLYSEVLREAPVKLDFEKIEVKNSMVEYEEKVAGDLPPAMIGFYDVDADIVNLTNIDLGRKDFPRTRINANGSFQKTTPVHVDLSFNVTNPENKFLVSGEVGRLPASALNPLLQPSMNVKAEGAIKDTYFTFTGTEDLLRGDVRLNYDHFKVVLLEDDGTEKQGFLSALANLFVDNDGLEGENAVKDITVQRDKQKSFWNFMWSGLRKGISEAIKQI